MGLQRRKTNQLAEAEAKATAEIAAEAAAADPQQQQQQQQRRAQKTSQPPLNERSPLVSYFVTVALACAFWTFMQLVHKYAHRMSGV
jgi:regulator of protease activity HflC (stomatin/prohibitin superfamily)